jgi:YVTN family beta-propeller protein
MSERLSGTVTFLFTDIEGSTSLLKQLGRARYGELLARQQLLLREAFLAHQGEEVDTQGDSFFVAFRSAPDAVAAAVAIHRSLADHEWPEGVEVRVRIGIHTGEAAAAGERYVGFSVHRAARIGDAAHGGQVLLSSTTTDLAEDDLPDGVFLRDLGSWRLKDVDRPERISQVVAEGLQVDFPPLRGAEPIKEKPVLRRRSVLAAALVGVVAAAVAIPVFALGGGSGGSEALANVEANAVGVIDGTSGKIHSQIPFGEAPGGIATGAGAIWVSNSDGSTVSRIDPKTNTLRQTIQIGAGPAGIAAGGGAVWAANGLDGTVSRIDPGTNQVVQTIPVGNGPAGVSFGSGAVWVANSVDGTISRIDPRTGRVTRTTPAAVGAKDIAVSFGRVWAVSPSSGTLVSLDPAGGSLQSQIGVGVDPEVAAAYRFLAGPVRRLG